MMNFNKLIRPAVGADLSRLPSSAPGSGVADLSALGGCSAILMKKLKFIFVILHIREEISEVA